jgi:hypothetical protein
VLSSKIRLICSMLHLLQQNRLAVYQPVAVALRKAEDLTDGKLKHVKVRNFF